MNRPPGPAPRGGRLRAPRPPAAASLSPGDGPWPPGDGPGPPGDGPGPPGDGPWPPGDGPGPDAPRLPRALQPVRTAMRRLAQGRRVAVAVSGGADSVVLLHLLAGMQEPLEIRVAAAHFDHRWRGAESAADARFVERLARRLGVPFHLERAATPAPDSNREAQARHARYAFLQGLVERGDVDLVATAHTLDDQAETVLDRILNGAGGAGLTGIHERQAGWLIRPLLGVRRTDLRAWAAAQNLEWREDSSNQDRRYRRNRVRLDLLPLLEREYNSRIAEALARMAEVAQAEEEYWNRRLTLIEKKLCTLERGGVRVGLAGFRRLEVAGQRRLMRRLLREAKPLRSGRKGWETPSRRVDFSHVEAARLLAVDGRKGQRVQAPGMRVEHQGRELWIHPQPAGAGKPSPLAAGKRTSTKSPSARQSGRV